MPANNSTDGRVGWVDSPNGRGTIDILWACILTIFLCVWTVLTLNVPVKDTTFLTFTRTKLKWMTLTLFGPEWLTASAGAQWSIARSSVKSFKAAGYDWSMRQAFFADMGGIRVRLEDEEFPATSKQVFVLVGLGMVKTSAIPLAAINDRSKTDGIAKLFTIMQTAWFCLQCAVRLEQQISITSLELSTIAFVVCTIGTNMLWWSKPKDVFVPITIDIDCTLKTLLELAESDVTNPGATVGATDWVWSPLEKFDDLRPNLMADVWPFLKSWPILRSMESELSQMSQRTRLRNDCLPPFKKDWALISYFISISLCFGGVYVAGWHIEMPTYVEQVIWRVSIVATLSLVVAFWLAELLGELLINLTRKTSNEPQEVAMTPVKLVLFGAITVTYVSVRLYILFESFFALRSQPQAIFESVDWTGFLPHI